MQSDEYGNPRFLKDWNKNDWHVWLEANKEPLKIFLENMFTSSRYI